MWSTPYFHCVHAKTLQTPALYLLDNDQTDDRLESHHVI